MRYRCLGQSLTLSNIVLRGYLLSSNRDVRRHVVLPSEHGIRGCHEGVNEDGPRPDCQVSDWVLSVLTPLLSTKIQFKEF